MDRILISRVPTQKWFLIGIPILFIVGSLMHFVYEWSGNLTLIGIFAPTNESVWEHLKMTFWPIMIWWSAGNFVFNKRKRISINQWFTSCATAELVCIMVIVCFFYTYTGVFGIESLILDIFSLFLGIATAFGMAFHVYKYAVPSWFYLYISIAILILLAISFTVFTFVPPHIPMFRDSSTGQYGI